VDGVVLGGDQLTDLGEVDDAVAIGEEAVVVDTGEARREDVLEEATQELDGLSSMVFSAL
jgi:hypothetical protein